MFVLKLTDDEVKVLRAAMASFDQGDVYFDLQGCNCEDTDAAYESLKKKLKSRAKKPKEGARG